MIQQTRPRCWVERVVDSDTLILWIEATPDVRIRYRVRIVGIEGGELADPEGPRGAASMAEQVAAMAEGAIYWSGSFNTTDQHGRLVGDIFDAEGGRLSLRLLQCGSHWRRSRSGIQRRGQPQEQIWQRCS